MALNRVPMLGKKADQPTTWQLGKREAWQDVKIAPRSSKRAPWSTSSWANLVYKPAGPVQSPNKRLVWQDEDFGGPFLDQAKRSASPRNWNAPWANAWVRAQGFRYNDGGHRDLARDMVYKRGDGEFDRDQVFYTVLGGAKDLAYKREEGSTSRVDRVDRLSKRDPEPYIESDGQAGEAQYPV